MNTQQKMQQQLATLAEHLRLRRSAILKAWRATVDKDPDLTTGSALSRTLFNDHIPEILDSFARRLQAWPDETSIQVQGQEDEGMAAHGLHRWQQGFRLRELTREWGYFQLCLVDELQSYARAHPELEPLVLASALQALTQLCVAGVSDSVEQYWQLQQAEAAGRLHELEQAVVTVNEIETARAAGWHQATHDMLDNLVDLARLDAGQEQRTIAPFNAAALVGDFCAMMQPVAHAHALSLQCEGAPSILVEGDRAKVQRIIQNLVLNAFKYTRYGGVVMRWETSQDSDANRWMVSVQDTGPGFNGTLGVSVVGWLREATQGAQRVQAAALFEGTSSNQDKPAVTLLSQSPQIHPDSPLHKQAGEGIGLSIVKGLCDLLDATLEVETSLGQGSTFRVTFPCSYPQ